jgi:hypothetical protein
VLDRIADSRLNEYEIGDGDPMVSVEVAGERCKGPIGHSNG